MKKPSLPSLIGSAITYIALGPTGLSNICPRSHALKIMKASEITNAENPIRFAVEFDMIRLNRKIDTGTAANNPYFMVANSLFSDWRYSCRM
jgi:hypothetical protein